MRRHESERHYRLKQSDVCRTEQRQHAADGESDCKESQKHHDEERRTKPGADRMVFDIADDDNDIRAHTESAGRPLQQSAGKTAADSRAATPSRDDDVVNRICLSINMSAGARWSGA